MTDSNHTPSCYANTSTQYFYIPIRDKVSFSATFSTLGLISNLIAFIVLIKSYKETQNRSRSFFLIFLGGLVVTDFMGLLVTGSFVISFYVTHVDWRQSDPTCHFCNLMGISMVFYGLSPLLLGATMAIERFIGINHPFARSSRLSKGRTVFMVLMVWFVAGSISLLPLAGFGSYHIQTPGSWCFLNISTKTGDWAFALLFSFVGLISIIASFLLNTVSVVTLIKVCCGAERKQRRRDHEVEMMVQLILIMTIATVCWCPLLIYILMKTLIPPASDAMLLFLIRMATWNQILDPWIYIIIKVSSLRRVFIAQSALSGAAIKYLLLGIRFATCNQILDPLVYILFRRSVLQKVNPRANWSRGSISTLSSLRDNVHQFTRSSLGSNRGSRLPENPEKSNVMPAPQPSSCLVYSDSELQQTDVSVSVI